MLTKPYTFQLADVRKLHRHGGRCLVSWDMGLGKAQPHDARVLTPNGWMFMGDVVVDDFVVGADGRPTRVVAIHPQGDRDVYRVTFRDGAAVECTDDHLWSVNTPHRKRTGRPNMVMRLSDIKGSLYDAAGNCRYFIPVVAPIEFAPSPVPLHPYLMGYLLANGCLRYGTPGVSIPDRETVDRIASLLPPEVALSSSSEPGNVNYSLVRRDRTGGPLPNPIAVVLRDFGLFGRYSHEKFIPASYRYNSLEVRVQLFQGLMDGDGYVTANSDNLGYSTSSRRLASHVRDLIRSLGGICRMRYKATPKYTHRGEQRVGRPAYPMTILLPNEIPPFQLRRKADVYKPRTKYLPNRAVVKVEQIGRKPCKCITVEAADGLYVTDDYAVTHNSLLSLLFAERHPHLRPVVVVCQAGLKINWAREMAKHIGMTAEILSGVRPEDRMVDLDREFVIVNYDVLPATRRGPGWLQYLRALKPQLVVLDECQALQDPGSLRTKACVALCDGVPHVLALSGTPLLNRPRELFPTLNLLRPDLFPSFYQYGHRYCLPGDAPILMGDLVEKPIRDVKIGDYVMGWGKRGGKQKRLVRAKVLDVIVKRAPLQRVTLQDGTVLICTPDHKWATGEKIGSFYEYAEARTGVLCGFGKKSASRVMKVFKGTAPVYDESADYMKGYVHGFFRGDGHCSRQREVREHPFRGTVKEMCYGYKVGCACKDKQPVQRISRYLSALGVDHEVRVRSDGLYAVTRMDRADCYEFIAHESVAGSDAWWAGFLGGIYDAEGSGPYISQYSRVNSVTFAMIKSGLERFSFGYKEHDEYVFMRGGREEFLRFWCIANPTLRRKLCKSVITAGGKLGGGVSGNSPQFVVGIEPVAGLHTTYTLTTETGNYVAYGCGSKNCGAKKSHWNRCGWDFSGASNLDELHGILVGEGVMLRRTKTEVLHQLPKKRRGVVTLGMSKPDEYRHAEEDFIGWLRQQSPGKAKRAMYAERLVKVGYLKRLAARLKLPAVFEWLDDFRAGSDEKMILFCVHKTIVADLHARYKGESVVVDGSVTGRKRQRAIDQFLRCPKTRFLVGNVRAAGAGWSAKGVRNVAFVELDWTPGVHAQGEDRAYGIGRGVAGQSTMVWYLIAAGTIEDRLLRILQDKQTALDAVLDGKARTDFDVHDALIRALLEGGPTNGVAHDVR